MDAERTREFLLTLPHAVETVCDTTRWGNKLVFRVGDQAAGDRMFSQFDFDRDGRVILSFATNPERYHDLVERDGIIPAPYRARLHWVALMRWEAIGDMELKELLRDSSAITFAKLPKRVRDLLAMKSAKRKQAG
jgi:predicted DNA-binding protein (MmcQ/YjbR family)